MKLFGRYITPPWERCYCVHWEWPLVWKKTALSWKSEAFKEVDRRVEREVAAEREQLRKLIPKVVKVGHRQFNKNSVYTIQTSIDASMFYGVYDRGEQEYFARYVGEYVECEVRRLLVTR